jgi:hypothetical protein
MNEWDLMNEQFRQQSNIQSQVSEDQAKLYAPQLREQVAEAQAAVIAQTNPIKALKVILEGFRGNIIDEYGDIVKVGMPIMNEEGIAKIASILIPFISDPIRFGNINGKEVRMITLQVANDISKNIGLNWRDYGVPDSSTQDLIVDSLLTLILITLTRSEEQGEKNWLGKVVLESISQGRNPQGKHKGGSWKDMFKL